MKIIVIVLSIFMVIFIFGFWVLCAYYRVKYVEGTKNKFKRQIEEILERHDIFDDYLLSELTELISGEKIISSK